MHEMMIAWSGLSQRWYAFKSFTRQGPRITVTGKKWDVTDQIVSILKAHEQNLGITRSGETVIVQHPLDLKRKI